MIANVKPDYGQPINWPRNICIVRGCGIRPQEGGLCSGHWFLWLATVDGNEGRAKATQAERIAWANEYASKRANASRTIAVNIPRVVECKEVRK